MTETEPLLNGEKQIKGGQLAYIIMMVFGLASLLPWNMFITATAYFQGKFNATESDTIITNFPSYFQIGGIVSNVVLSLSSMIIIRYVKIGHLINFSNIIMLAGFILTTVFSKVNTDSWPVTFFILTNITFCVMSALTAIYVSSMMAMASMMPPDSIKGFFLGQALAGLFATCLTIITLSIPGADTDEAGFYYFLIACVTLSASLTLYVVFKRMPYVRYYLEKGRESSSSENESQGVEKVAKLSLFQLFIETHKYSIASFFALLYTLVMFPAVMSRLQSTGPDGRWSQTYFLPVIVFLGFNFGDVVGRVSASFVRWPGKKSIMWVSIARIIFIPLLLMCNLQPRSISVWFESDYIALVLIFLFGWSNGHILSLAVSYAPQDVVGDINKASIGTIQAFSCSVGLVVGSCLVFAVVQIV